MPLIIYLFIFNWRREAAIPQYPPPPPYYFSKNVTCYKPGIYFKALERWNKNSNVEIILVNQYFLLKYLVLTSFTFEVVHHSKVISLQSIIYSEKVVGIARKDIDDNIIS